MSPIKYGTIHDNYLKEAKDCNFLRKKIYFFYIFRRIHISEMLPESSIEKFLKLAE